MSAARIALVALVISLGGADPSEAGTIVVKQDTQPNSSTVFSYTAGGGLSPTSFQLDDDGANLNAHPSSVTFANLPAASGYSVTQNMPTPAGYNAPVVTCSDGSSPSNIDLAANETVTCTFANRLSTAGTLKIVKDALPDDPQSFQFDTYGPTPPGHVGAFLTDNGGGSKNSATYVVNPGSNYRIFETVPDPWVPQSATCSDGSSVMSITISPNENVVCTFVNLKQGQIRVVKDAQPDDTQVFDFTAGGGLSPSSFSLDDYPHTRESSRAFSVNPGSGYSVAETVPAGWHQSAATCSDGSPVSNIDVSAGEIVTCTFTNVADEVGTITIRKDSVPDSGQVFAFYMSPALSDQFRLADDGPGGQDGERTITVRKNIYRFDEATFLDWHQTSATCDDGSPVTAVNVSAGENVVCTFVNKQNGSIRIVKDAQPDGPQDFAFTYALPGFGSGQFLLDDDGDATLPNSAQFSVRDGSGYSVAETTAPGWEQSSATCNDGSPISNISVDPGEFVTCTFVNQQVRKLRVRQQTQPDDPQDFSFSASGAGVPPNFQLDDDGNDSNELPSTVEFSGLGPGPYSLSQGAVPGYDLTDATCSDGSPISAIDIAPGETVECTFTDLSPDAAAIKVVKDAQPDSVQPFLFHASGGATPASFALDDDGDEGNARASSRLLFVPTPGAGYSVSEDVPAGWERTSAICSDGSPVTNIDVSAGERITCTFVNDRLVEYLGYPRPKAATPFYASLVNAYDCEFPNRAHAPPLNYASCAPPRERSSAATSGNPIPDEAQSNLVGSLRMVTTGSGASADVAVTVNVVDVRCKVASVCGSANNSSAADYVGELKVRGVLRATDRLNGSGTGGPGGTLGDIEWGPTVPCSTSSSVLTGIGSTCALTTTFNTLIPGSVVGGARSIWQLDQVTVYDGGPDGDGDTAGDNTPFLRQGVFVP